VSIPWGRRAPARRRFGDELELVAPRETVPRRFGDELELVAPRQTARRLRCVTCALLLLLASAAAAAEPAILLSNQPYVEAGAPRQVLDLWTPPAPGAPILLFVHGGAWSKGDKRPPRALPAFAAEQGWTLASLNYRLAPKDPHPAQVQDVAAAIAWLHAHAAAHGADGSRIALIGASAGAHLVALAVADPQYLQAVQVPRDVIRAVMPVDCASYDIRPLNPGQDKEFHIPIFGREAAGRAAASPTRQVRADAAMPPFLLVTNSLPNFRNQAQGLHDALLAASHRSTLIEVPDIDHNGLCGAIAQKKLIATPAMAELLRSASRPADSRPVPAAVSDSD
jgi:arylformamidase